MDTRKFLHNAHKKQLYICSNAEDNDFFPFCLYYTGLYCSGWVKRGPVGVILSSLNDSIETAKTITTDIEEGILIEKTSKASLLDLLTSRGKYPLT